MKKKISKQQKWNKYFVLLYSSLCMSRNLNSKKNKFELTLRHKWQLLRRPEIKETFT